MRFNEDTHRYTLPENYKEITKRTLPLIKLPKIKDQIHNDIPFLSATTFIHSIEPKVDWEEKARKYALKHNMTIEDVKAKWNKAKEDALKKGTAHHLWREQQTLSSAPPPDYSIHTHSQTSSGDKIDSTLILSPQTIYPEKMVWLSDYRLCGTADLVEVDKENRIHIKDYKSSKELYYESWGGRTINRPTYLLPPVSHLQECNMSLYNLQLSLYMYMFLVHNPDLLPGSLTILHERFQGDKYTHTEDHPLPYLRREIEDLLHYREAQLRKTLLSQ